MINDSCAFHDKWRSEPVRTGDATPTAIARYDVVRSLKDTFPNFRGSAAESHAHCHGTFIVSARGADGRAHTEVIDLSFGVSNGVVRIVGMPTVSHRAHDHEHALCTVTASADGGAIAFTAVGRADEQVVWTAYSDCVFIH